MAILTGERKWVARSANVRQALRGAVTVVEEA